MCLTLIKTIDRDASPGYNGTKPVTAQQQGRKMNRIDLAEAHRVTKAILQNGDDYSATMTVVMREMAGGWSGAMRTGAFLEMNAQHHSVRLMAGLRTRLDHMCAEEAPTAEMAAVIDLALSELAAAPRSWWDARLMNEDIVLGAVIKAVVEGGCVLDKVRKKTW